MVGHGINGARVRCPNCLTHQLTFRSLVLQVLDIYRAIALGTAEFETEDALEIIFVSPLIQKPSTREGPSTSTNTHQSRGPSPCQGPNTCLFTQSTPPPCLPCRAPLLTLAPFFCPICGRLVCLCLQRDLPPTISDPEAPYPFKVERRLDAGGAVNRTVALSTVRHHTHDHALSIICRRLKRVPYYRHYHAISSRCAIC